MKREMAEHSRAVVAMSGGVDSSVAALRMMERGFDCIGVTIKLFDNEDVGVLRERTCCSLEDVEDTRIDPIRNEIVLSEDAELYTRKLGAEGVFVGSGIFIR